MEKFDLLIYDEGNQKLARLHTDTGRIFWSLDLAQLPLTRDLQRLDEHTALVGFDRGYAEIDLRTGAIIEKVELGIKVSSARRLPDGTTLVTGVDLAGLTGVCVLTILEDKSIGNAVARPGNYVRLMRPTPEGTLLLCTNDHILETTNRLEPIRELRAPGFLHAWKAHRYPDGSTLVAGGYGAFMARFSKSGQLTSVFDGKGDLSVSFNPNFYASFELLTDGSFLLANWLGHGPGNGNKGAQLLRFDHKDRLIETWSLPDFISSLQGILVLSHPTL